MQNLSQNQKYDQNPTKIPIYQFSDQKQAQNTSLDSATAYKSKQQPKSSLK